MAEIPIDPEEPREDGKDPRDPSDSQSLRRQVRRSRIGYDTRRPSSVPRPPR